MSDLEQRLTQLGRELDWPETPDLAPAVRRRLAAPTRQPRRRPVLLRRSFAIAIAALLLLAGGVFAAVPGVRDAVLEFFGLQGATVERRAKLPEAPELRPLNLGTRTTLAGARRSLGFDPLVPVAAGRPDAVYTSQQVPGGELSLAYRPRPGLPEAHSTSLGLLVGEFRGDLAPEYLGKIAGQTTQIERLRVDGAARDLDRGRAAPVLLPAAGFRLRGERAAPRRQRAAAGAREPDGAPGGRVRPRASAGARPLAALVPLRKLDALEHVQVLVQLDAPWPKEDDAPFGRELCEQPLGRQERGAPVRVRHSVIACPAEFGLVPEAWRVSDSRISASCSGPRIHRDRRATIWHRPHVASPAARGAGAGWRTRAPGTAARRARRQSRWSSSCRGSR